MAIYIDGKLRCGQTTFDGSTCMAFPLKDQPYCKKHYRAARAGEANRTVGHDVPRKLQVKLVENDPNVLTLRREAGMQTAIIEKKWEELSESLEGLDINSLNQHIKLAKLLADTHNDKELSSHLASAIKLIDKATKSREAEKALREIIREKGEIVTREVNRVNVIGQTVSYQLFSVIMHRMVRLFMNICNQYGLPKDATKNLLLEVKAIANVPSLPTGDDIDS